MTTFLNCRFYCIFTQPLTHGDTLQDYVEALKLYKKAAQFGSHLAYFRLGQMHKNGEGCIKDLKQSLKYFKYGADNGYIRSYAEMAEIYQDLKHVENALKCWNRYLTSPDFLNQIIIDNLYAKANYLFSFFLLCIPNDEILLLEFKEYLSGLSKEIRDELNEEIQSFSDQLLESSIEQKVDYLCSVYKNIKEFRKLIYDINENKVDPYLDEIERYIICDVAWEYHMGDDEQNDYKKAFDLYQELMEIGSKSAPFQIAQLYQFGSEHGFDKNLDLAIKYLNEAIKRGNYQGYWALANIYYEEKNDFKKALEYWFKYFKSDAFLKSLSEIDAIFTRGNALEFISYCIKEKDDEAINKFKDFINSLPDETKQPLLSELLNDTTDNVNQYKREIEEDDDDLYFDYLKVELDMSIKVKDHIELLFD